MTSYNPIKYWTEHGRTYMTKHLSRTKTDFTHRNRFQIQEQAIIQYLDKLYPSFETVLELGAGFGRISKLLIDRYQSITNYTLVDLSPSQIKNAKKYLSNSNKVGIEYHVSTIENFYSPERYDLVLLSEVLMHQFPSKMPYLIDIIVSLSKKHIINIDWYEVKQPAYKIADHNFIHDYQKLYMQNQQVQNVIQTPIKHINQSIFHTQVIV